MLRICVCMHSRFFENHPIWILEDGLLISEVVLSLGAATNRKGSTIDHQGAADLALLRPEKLLLRDVFIMEAINLNIWIFMPAPQWAPSIVLCDINLEYGWSRDRKNVGNIGDARIFRQVQAFQSIITLHLVFLYCSRQLTWWLLFFELVLTCLLGGASTLPFTSKGDEVIKKITESAIIWSDSISNAYILYIYIYRYNYLWF
jgi:hypothetical protein